MMRTCIHMTVGDLVAALFDETRNLNGLKRLEKNLLVAIMFNDCMLRSARRSRSKGWGEGKTL